MSPPAALRKAARVQLTPHVRRRRRRDRHSVELGLAEELDSALLLGARRAWRNATARMGAGFAGSGLTWFASLVGCVYPTESVGLLVIAPRVVENVRRLKADEAAVSTGEGERFRASVDRVASDDMLERDPFVPPVPLLVAAERATHARASAVEEIKDALRPNHAPILGDFGGLPSRYHLIGKIEVITVVIVGFMSRNVGSATEQTLATGPPAACGRRSPT